MVNRLALVLVLLLCSSPVYADESKVTPLTKLDDATKKMLDGLDSNQTKQFAAIRNSHGIIRAVEDVEATLDKAKNSCIQNNPDLADKMAAQSAHFKTTIDPILDDARQRLNTMVKLQDFAKASEAKTYLKTVDDAVAYKARGVKTVPVTKQDECEKLLDKMSESEGDLKKLLIENLGLNRDIQVEDSK